MSREIVDALSNGDNLEAESNFNQSLSHKVGDALEARRKEIATTFVKTMSGENEENWGNLWIYSCREGWT